MKRIFVLIAICFYNLAQAQQFISNGLVEYEARVDNYKSHDDATW